VSILYPIAANAELALTAPKGRAARERDAEILIGEGVRFVSEFTGPVFKSEAAARAAYQGRLDDERAETRTTIVPEDRYCDLKPIVDRGLRRLVGRQSLWRLSVSYWRTGGLPTGLELEQARKARRNPKAEPPDTATLDTLARQPLRPVRPQQPLDVGLFEVRLPEAPHIIVPDE
jgi:hypothetical protein